jgi:hypothetical protein
MKDAYSKNLNWYVPRATVALLAGFATAVGVSQIGNQTGLDQHVERCVNQYANLASVDGPFGSVVSMHKIQAGINDIDMVKAQPACNDAHIERSTNVIVEQGNEVLGTIPLLTPNNDQGGLHIGNLITAAPLKCDTTETVIFDTTASSGLTGIQVAVQQAHTFTTACH